MCSLHISSAYQSGIRGVQERGGSFTSSALERII